MFVTELKWGTKYGVDEECFCQVTSCVWLKVYGNTHMQFLHKIIHQSSLGSLHNFITGTQG